MRGVTGAVRRRLAAWVDSAAMYWTYFRAVLRHKRFVFVECWREGLYLAAFTHDLSKFRPDEFIPYARWFYGPYGARDKGRNLQVRDDYHVAWLKHIRRNPHHWQHWVLQHDDGSSTVLYMPRRYRREMICDWRGAGKAYGNPNTLEWYTEKRRHLQLHAATRMFVDQALGFIAPRVYKSDKHQEMVYEFKDVADAVREVFARLNDQSFRAGSDYVPINKRDEPPI